jgi:hypothetical protein
MGNLSATCRGIGVNLRCTSGKKYMLNTKEAAEILTGRGINSTGEEVADLARKNLFPNAVRADGK